ncbi:MAG: hypothetical protein ABI769_01710 [Pseudomonadota bacterium]
MAVPWLVVGNLVLNNLDKIIGVVNPAFTRKKADVSSAQFELLNQQIAELQAAASNNAEQITQLAAQVKEVVAALAQAGVEAVAQRAASRRLSRAALAASVVAVLMAGASLLTR